MATGHHRYSLYIRNHLYWQLTTSHHICTIGFQCWINSIIHDTYHKTHRTPMHHLLRYENGFTPMHWAAQHGRRDLVEFICEKVAGSLRNEEICENHEMISWWMIPDSGLVYFCLVFLVISGFTKFGQDLRWFDPPNLLEFGLQGESEF